MIKPMKTKLLKRLRQKAKSHVVIYKSGNSFKIVLKESDYDAWNSNFGFVDTRITPSDSYFKEDIEELKETLKEARMYYILNMIKKIKDEQFFKNNLANL